MGLFSENLGIQLFGIRTVGCQCKSVPNSQLLLTPIHQNWVSGKLFTLNYIQTFTSAIKRFMAHSIHFKCPVYQFLMHWFALWLAVLCAKKGNCPIARKQVHFVIGLVDSVLYAWQTGKWSILQEFKSQKYFKTSVLISWYIHVEQELLASWSGIVKLLH